VLANGTYFLCIVHPSSWLIPGENMTDTGHCRPAVPWR
jgi:hypothetical protein